MKIPEISDDIGRRAWMVEPRAGLLTSEIAPIIGESARSIRAAIREHELPGVAFKFGGSICGYGVKVDDIVSFHNCSPAIVAALKKLTEKDASPPAMRLGLPFFHTVGSDLDIEFWYEFDNVDEFRQINN